MIVVFGSINMDVSMRVKSFPERGETTMTHAYDMSPGGKGANQAMASARRGVKTAMVGKVGDDGLGNRLTQNLRRNEVMTSGVAVSDYLPTGMAYVLTDAGGENQIVVASGANADAGADQVPDEILKKGNLLLLQMEVQPEHSVTLMHRARAQDGLVILNLAPFFPLPKEAVGLADWLIVNEGEGAALAASLGLSQNRDHYALARALSSACHVHCIVTLGAKGAVAALKDGTGLKVAALTLDKVVDTTGAGDCFCGTFAACLYEKMTAAEAMRHASVASGLSCLKKGAQDSYPYSGDVVEAMAGFPAAEHL